MNQEQTIVKKNKLEPELLFKVSRFKEYIKKTVPHKHDDYHELIFIAQGEGFHTIESEKFIVNAPEFYYLQPGQMHFWQFTAIPKGFVILFKPSFLDDIRDSEIIKAYRGLSKSTHLVLDEGKYPTAILEELLKSYQSDTTHSDFTTKCLLGSLLGVLLGISASEDSNPNISTSTFDKFQSLLLEHIPQLHLVKDYAEKLNTTPQNLNILCKKQNNKTAKDIINDRLEMEAKRYILHTDQTISEIAHTMGFTDDSNFTKFFKKEVGMTPLQFRNQYFH